MNCCHAVIIVRAAGRQIPDNLSRLWRAWQPAVQIAIANHAKVEQSKADGDDPVSMSDDASWLPPARGYTEIEDNSVGQSEQDLEDQIQTKWSQVRRWLT